MDQDLEYYEELLRTYDMGKFTFACDQLAAKGSKEACFLMKPYLGDRDIYKRRYALLKLFSLPYRDKEVEKANREALLSPEMTLVYAALHNYEISDAPMPEAEVKAVVKRNLRALGSGLQVLRRLSQTKENTAYLLELFREAPGSLESEILADELESRGAEDLFALFSCAPYASIRCRAVRIAKTQGLDCSSFLQDPDGHVRKAAARTGVCAP